MGRKPNPHARPYQLTPEARAQRKQAAIDRWNALADADKAARSLPGRPRKKLPRRHAVRDEATGKFVRAK